MDINFEELGELDEMLKAEIAKWADRYSDRMSQRMLEQAINAILLDYEDLQEWDGDVMITGASANDINTWLNESEQAVQTLLVYEEIARTNAAKTLLALGADGIKITDAIDTCYELVRGVKDYAENHGYKEDAEWLDISRDDFVAKVNIVTAESSPYLSRDFTDAVTASCYRQTEATLSHTRLFNERNVSLNLDVLKVSGVQIQFRHDDTVHGKVICEDVKNNVGEILDRFANQKAKTRTTVERE